MCCLTAVATPAYTASSRAGAFRGWRTGSIQELTDSTWRSFPRGPSLQAVVGGKRGGQLTPNATPPLVRPLPPGLKVGLLEDGGLTRVEIDRYGRRG